MDALAVTRELKIALIVGFSLVLVVTVLISDHLSKARRSDLDSKLADRPQLVPAPPAESIEPAPMRPAPVGPMLADAGSARVEPVVEIQQTTGVSRGSVREPDAGTQPDLFDRVNRQIQNGEITLPPAVKLEPVAPAPAPVGRGAPNVLNPDGPVGHGLTGPGNTPPAPVPTGPGTTPQAQPKTLPPAVPDREYIVAEGDSAFAIAKKTLGAGDKWRELAAYNPGRIGPNGQIRPGVRLKIPGKVTSTTELKSVPVSTQAAKPAQPVAAPTGPRTYTVKKGDTLGQISARELKSSKRVQEIIDLNSGTLDDADDLRVGMVLKMPAK